MYKYEITDVLEANDIDPRDAFRINVQMHTVPGGIAIDLEGVMPEPSIIFDAREGNTRVFSHSVKFIYILKER